ncbi:hypothetical protein PSQ19_02795 [Devosia algicola]|uniref:Bacterial alpha-2-macroglobulin MG10 domain-containing protein n=1 Tax=Devosia algicola TaxID=3026418 RepID=A0ABY7YP89_9HYPH|nr:hypothetical protein [Devosia algicola]WDR03140.1 hypothetical protein PSQ19_02795 [Devosia algicola]
MQRHWPRLRLGAALALYGDNKRAAVAFSAAVARLDNTEADPGYRADYGSRLRDTAGVLALAAEFSPTSVDLVALARDVGTLRDAELYTSTQEDSWTLLAAAATGSETTEGAISLDGDALSAPLYRRYDRIGFVAHEIANTGDTDSEVNVTVSGYPTTQPAATSNGFTLSREYFLPDGSRVDPELTPIAQNTRLVVVLTIRPKNLGSGQYLVADPLPAGFEIENPDLSAGGGAADYRWLKLNQPNHVESRTDQYVAAFRYSAEQPSITTAYLVRAVSPGTFVLPGATVEDMYRPQFRANTAAGSLEVTATGP